jgi:DUF4097 and DUF4098 domain-containing protein YvlB
LAEYEREVQVSAPLAAGSIFAAQTSRGSLTITGADVADCNVTAKITARAVSEEEAKRLAEETKITLEPSGNKLICKIERPVLINNQSVGVSLTATVPRQTTIECRSSRGSIDLSNIEGDVKGRTSRGSITVEHVSGSVDLNTSRGAITCKDISGANLELVTSRGNVRLTNASADSLKLRSSRGSIDALESSASVANISTSRGHISCREIKFGEVTAGSSRGNIHIGYSASGPSDVTAKMVATRGSICVKTPPGFAGQVDLSATRGSIKTEVPITIKGDFSKQRVKGTIGEGKGKLRLQTSRGSIRIR